jgi:hypothetical protein
VEQPFRSSVRVYTPFEKCSGPDFELQAGVLIFGSGIPCRLLLHVPPVKSTSVPLRFS